MLRSASLAAQKGMGPDEAYVRNMLGFVWGPLLDAIPKVSADWVHAAWRSRRDSARAVAAAVDTLPCLPQAQAHLRRRPASCLLCIPSSFSFFIPPAGAGHGDPGEPAGGG